MYCVKSLFFALLIIAGVGLVVEPQPAFAHSSPYSFEEMMRRAHDYALQEGYRDAFPNFFSQEYRVGDVIETRFGTIMLNGVGVEWRDISARELKNPRNTRERFTHTYDWATQHGYVGGIPNFHQADYGNGIVYGTFLLSSEVAEWRHLHAGELGNPDSSNPEAFFAAVHDYAWQNGFVSGFPNFHVGNGGYGVILLKHVGTEYRDINGVTYGVPNRSANPPPPPSPPSPPPSSTADVTISYMFPTGMTGIGCVGTVEYALAIASSPGSSGRTSAYGIKSFSNELATNIDGTSGCLLRWSENQLAPGTWDIAVYNGWFLITCTKTFGPNSFNAVRIISGVGGGRCE